jgi:hypothetical protein
MVADMASPIDHKWIVVVAFWPSFLANLHWLVKRSDIKDLDVSVLYIHTLHGQ